MKRYLCVGRVLLALAPLLTGSAAHAVTLANRVFVSQRSGNDANPCNNILTPCQTFAGAVLQLNPGGEAIVLDSGGYGPVTITQSLTIEAPPGVLAFIHPPSGVAVTVNAGASDTVVLRGLVLNGGAGDAIAVNTVKVLHVENCVIEGFGGDGVLGNAANSNLFMKDTISRQNGFGIIMANGQASIDHCRFEGNVNDGVFVDGADVSVRDSVSAGNGFNGFEAVSKVTERSVLNVYQSSAVNNGNDGIGVRNDGSGVVNVRVANSSIGENLGHGLNNFAGSVTFESLGNNFVRGNIAGNTNGTITPITGQ
jgi:hypothetical protein